MNGVFEVLRAGHRIWRSPELGGKIYVCYEDKCFVLYTSSRFVVYKNHQLLFRHICNEFELCNEFEFQICLQLAILIKINTNNPSQTSVVLESSVKPVLDCLLQQPRFSLTTVRNLKNHHLVQSGRG